MDELYLSSLDLAEEFTPDVIGLVCSGYSFNEEDLDKLDELYIYNFYNSKNIDARRYGIAVKVCEAIIKDANINRLNSDEIRIVSNDKTKKLELVWLSRKEVERWLLEKGSECPEVLRPRILSDTYKKADQKLGEKLRAFQSLEVVVDDTSMALDLEKLRDENTQLKGELAKLNGREWRKAFEYKSELLDALFDMIEEYYLDDSGKQISISELPLKKSLTSRRLSGRTIQEADTIITSGKRKGRAKT